MMIMHGMSDCRGHRTKGIEVSVDVRTGRTQRFGEEHS
jgi:hypothetical protein